MKICGGSIALAVDKSVGICEYCGSSITLPKIDDDRLAALFNRGNSFRMAGEFDKALEIYEKIIEITPGDAEAHWCAAISRFGIEWVEDPVSLEYLPTCHRASYDIFTSDPDYISALEYSDGIAQRQYKKDAARIVDVQKRILEVSNTEKPYDVFICYKESNFTGERTIDSTLAQDIYYRLIDEGFRVFFSRISLEDKVGSEYEPIVFAALNSSKVMVVVGTKPEYFNSVWVKNEWSRYLAIVRKDRKKLILPCYRDMNPYELPRELGILQSYDMSRIGFIQDLIRGIKKVLNDDNHSTEAFHDGIKNENNDATHKSLDSSEMAKLLTERAYQYLSEAKWDNADDYASKALVLDHENSDAYIIKLLVELRIRKFDLLKTSSIRFDNNLYYTKAWQYGNQDLRNALKAAVLYKKDRTEKELLNPTITANNLSNNPFGNSVANALEPNFKITFKSVNPSVKMVVLDVATGQKEVLLPDQSLSYYLPVGKSDLVIKIGKKNYKRSVVVPDNRTSISLLGSFTGRTNQIVINKSDAMQFKSATRNTNSTNEVSPSTNGSGMKWWVWLIIALSVLIFIQMCIDAFKTGAYGIDETASSLYSNNNVNEFMINGESVNSVISIKQ